MGGVAKAVTKVVGSIFGGGKPSAAAPVAQQVGAPAASAASAVQGPPKTIGTVDTNVLGTSGADSTKKGSRRSRGRFETLLSDLGGAAERFGD